MTLLGNDNVNYGDKVFDIVHGYGTVISTEFNEIQVKLDNGIQLTYNHKGYYGGTRRLYWHNPIVIDPPKSIPFWDTLKKCIYSIYDHLNP